MDRYEMRNFRWISFAICGAAILMSMHAGSAEPRAPLTKLHGFSPSEIILFQAQNDFASPRPHSEPCRISPTEAERIERNTADPCLAADAVPGGVCFERLGNDIPGNAPAALQLNAPCGQ
jgi:hypothetical protein